LAYQITFPGGDAQSVLNAEYRIPIAGPVTVAAFTDVGTVGVFKRNQLGLNPANFSSLSTQFPGASLTSQLPLAANTNFRLRSSVGAEMVVNLPVLQAPFRLYWSYNFRRLSQQIVAPSSVFNIPDSVKFGLPPGVYESQIQPQLNNLLVNPPRINYFEAARTLRFTVSRTF
jgi:outer membrane protein insertion porin family